MEKGKFERSRPIVVTGAIGTGHAARLALLLQAAGMVAVVEDAPRDARTPAPTIHEPRRLAVHWDESPRKRAQWKNETNKRGRNR